MGQSAKPAEPLYRERPVAGASDPRHLMASAFFQRVVGWFVGIVGIIVVLALILHFVGVM